MKIHNFHTDGGPRDDRRVEFLRVPSVAVRGGEHPGIAERSHARLTGGSAAEHDHELAVAPALHQNRPVSVEEHPSKNNSTKAGTKNGKSHQVEGGERVHRAGDGAALVGDARVRLQLGPALRRGPRPGVGEVAGLRGAAEHDRAVAEAAERRRPAAGRLHALGLERPVAVGEEPGLGAGVEEHADLRPAHLAGRGGAGRRVLRGCGRTAATRRVNLASQSARTCRRASPREPRLDEVHPRSSPTARAEKGGSRWV